ncbi:MAG: cyclase family protein [Chlamydiae bacterium]|nr:cyclase family protein [Chlamydiota bacterium]
MHLDKIFRNSLTFVDLSHTLSSQSPSWNGSCGFFSEIKKDYDDMFRVQQFKMHAGIGTHMDAPSHKFQGSISIDEVAIENLFVPLHIIDVSHKSSSTYEISVKDILDYESRYGRIKGNSLVIGFTGWCHRFRDSNSYRNPDENGHMHFPSFSKDAALLLLDRDVAGLGIDTLSPDCHDKEYPVHHLFLGKGKYIIENVADCSLMMKSGGFAVALPLKIEGATESPIRLIGCFIKIR